VSRGSIPPPRRATRETERREERRETKKRQRTRSQRENRGTTRETRRKADRLERIEKTRKGDKAETTQKGKKEEPTHTIANATKVTVVPTPVLIKNDTQKKSEESAEKKEKYQFDRRKNNCSK